MENYDSDYMSLKNYNGTDDISGEMLVSTIIYYVTAFIIIVLSLVYISFKL